VGRTRGASKKIWDPLFISAIVKASNFNFGIQLGLGEELGNKQLLRPKCRGSGLGEHPKIWDSLFISATVEASNWYTSWAWEV